MTKKTIIALVGENSSGKGTVANFLIEEYGASYYRFSTPLFDIVKILYKPATRKILNDLSTKFRELYGEDYLAEVLAEQIKKDKKNLVVLDGLRKPKELKYFRNKLDNFYLLCITADVKIRYERAIQRAEKPDDKNKSFEQFKREDKGEADKDSGKIGKKADFTIKNNGTLEELQEKIKKVMNKFC